MTLIDYEITIFYKANFHLFLANTRPGRGAGDGDHMGSVVVPLGTGIQCG